MGFVKLITVQGETNHITYFCKKYGMNTSTYYDRINRGWEPEKAVITPIDPARRKHAKNRKQQLYPDY